MNFNSIHKVPTISGGKRDVTPPVRLVSNHSVSSTSPVQIRASPSPSILNSVSSSSNTNNSRSTTPLVAIQLSHSTSLRPSSNPRPSSSKKPRVSEAISFATFEAHRPISRSASRRKQRRWENMNMIESELTLLRNNNPNDDDKYEVVHNLQIETNSYFNDLFKKENYEIFEMFRKVEGTSLNISNNNTHQHTIKKYASKYSELLEYYRTNSTDPFFQSLLTSMPMSDYLLGALAWCQVDHKLRQVVEEKILNSTAFYKQILSELTQLLIAYGSEETETDDDWCFVSSKDVKTNIKLPITPKLLSFFTSIPFADLSNVKDIIYLDNKLRLCIKTSESPLTRLFIHAASKFFGFHSQSFALTKNTKGKEKIIVISKSKNISPTLKMKSSLSIFLSFHLGIAQKDDDYIFSPPTQSLHTLYISDITDDNSKNNQDPPVNEFNLLSINNFVEV